MSTFSRVTLRVRNQSEPIIGPQPRWLTAACDDSAGAGPGTFKKKKGARRATRQQLAAGRGPKSLQIYLDEVCRHALVASPLDLVLRQERV